MISWGIWIKNPAWIHLISLGKYNVDPYADLGKYNVDP